MTAAPPRTVEQYLDALRAALKGADPALVQDALYDAEEHLRAELAAHAGDAEGDVLARIVQSYGAPDEVADAYRTNEATIQKALRTPAPRPRTTALGRFFGIYADPRAYLSLLYLLLALVTGITYFTFATAGLSLSLGLAILIIGVPFFLLFIGSVRVISWVEGRIVETLLGVRMPRRLPSQETSGTLWSRIKHALSDARTWGTMFYMLLQLPLGVIYFTLSVALGVTSGALIAGGFHQLATGRDHIMVPTEPQIDAFLNTPPGLVLVVIVGMIGILLTLHVARALGLIHGKIAETLLVRA